MADRFEFHGLDMDDGDPGEEPPRLQFRPRRVTEDDSILDSRTDPVESGPGIPDPAETGDPALILGESPLVRFYFSLILVVVFLIGTVLTGGFLLYPGQDGPGLSGLLLGVIMLGAGTLLLLKFSLESYLGSRWLSWSVELVNRHPVALAVAGFVVDRKMVCFTESEVDGAGYEVRKDIRLEDLEPVKLTDLGRKRADSFRPRDLFGILVFTGLISLGLYIVFWTLIGMSSHFWPEVQGKLLSCEKECIEKHYRNSVDYYFLPRVTYAYELSGRRYVSSHYRIWTHYGIKDQDFVDELVQRLQQQKIVQVRYNPLHPGMALLEVGNGWWDWYYTLLSLLGLGSGVMGFLAMLSRGKFGRPLQVWILGVSNRYPWMRRELERIVTKELWDENRF